MDSPTTILVMSKSEFKAPGSPPYSSLSPPTFSKDQQVDRNPDCQVTTLAKSERGYIYYL